MVLLSSFLRAFVAMVPPRLILKHEFDFHFLLQLLPCQPGSMRTDCVSLEIYRCLEHHKSLSQAVFFWAKIMVRVEMSLQVSVVFKVLILNAISVTYEARVVILLQVIVQHVIVIVGLVTELAHWVAFDLRVILITLLHVSC
jgi:hypothetical protein